MNAILTIYNDAREIETKNNNLLHPALKSQTIQF